MKKRIYKQKRVTMLSLLIRAICVTAVLSLAFACGCETYLRKTISKQAEEQIEEQASLVQQYISEIQANKENIPLHMQEISAKMAIYMGYDIIIEDFMALDPNKRLVQIVPHYSSGCYAVGALVDEDNNIVASSRQTLLTYIKFSDKAKIAPDNGWYVCDNETLQIPEVDKLYDDYGELSQNYFDYLDMELTSAYVNKETHTFIPHKGTVTVYPDSDDTERTVYEIDITIDKADKEGYELINMHQTANSDSKLSFPRCSLSQFHGVKPGTQLQQLQGKNIVLLGESLHGRTTEE